MCITWGICTLKCWCEARWQCGSCTYTLTKHKLHLTRRNKITERWNRDRNETLHDGKDMIRSHSGLKDNLDQTLMSELINELTRQCCFQLQRWIHQNHKQKIMFLPRLELSITFTVRMNSTYIFEKKKGEESRKIKGKE